MPQIALFKNLSDDEISRILSLGRTLSVKKGEAIVNEGEPGDALYVIEGGSATVCKAKDDGSHEILSVLDKGELFGEMALIDKSPRSATVTAIEESKILKLLYSDLDELVSRDPRLASILYRNLAAVLSRRLRNLGGKIISVVNEGSAVKRNADAITKEMLSVLSHELRTPVTVIQGASDVLGDVCLTPKDQKKLLASIQKHTERLSHLFEDISNLADMQFGSSQMERTKLDVVKLIGQIVDGLAEAARGRGVSVEVSISKNLPGVMGSEKKLKRAIFHLIENGIKFNREGGRLTISAMTEKPGQLIVSFRDEGPGIPMERHEEIFRCFMQEKGSLDASRVAGIGIGLPLARSIIAAHGGRLWVESPPGGGSVFIFMIPIT